ncbi:MAG: twin-arginine translocase subunit TatC [Caulobacteraceae bacterium]
MSALDPDEAEIEASRAPLLEHLIELRKRLIICVVALFLGFGLCFAFSQQIYLFLLQPFEIAGRILDAQTAAGQKHSLWDPTLFLSLLGLKEIPQIAGHNLKLVFTAPLEFFFTKIKLAGFGAVMLTFPVLAWQLYRFVAPGLYRKERKAFLPFLLASPVLFMMGAALVYFFILPFVLWFSLSQQITGVAGVTVEMLPKVSDYLTLVTTLLLAFGLCFQLPVVLSLLGLAGLVSAKQLSSMRRYAIVGVFVVAAVVTPPDMISQLTLAIPLVLLYEISIWCVRLIEWRRDKDESRDVTVA